MKTYTVGEFKSDFSAILSLIRQGNSVGLAFGKRQERLAVLVPYKHYKQANKIKPGILKGKATFKTSSDFKISDEEFLQA